MKAATIALAAGASFCLEMPVTMNDLKYLWQHVYRKRKVMTGTRDLIESQASKLMSKMAIEKEEVETKRSKGIIKIEPAPSHNNNNCQSRVSINYANPYIPSNYIHEDKGKKKVMDKLEEGDFPHGGSNHRGKELMELETLNNTQKTLGSHYNSAQWWGNYLQRQGKLNTQLIKTLDHGINYHQTQALPKNYYSGNDMNTASSSYCENGNQFKMESVSAPNGNINMVPKHPQLGSSSGYFQLEIGSLNSECNRWRMKRGFIDVESEKNSKRLKLDSDTKLKGEEEKIIVKGDCKEVKQESGEINTANNNSPKKRRPRIVWTSELHMKFVAAISELGDKKSSPKYIQEKMNVPELTQRQIASHLQKYKSQVRRILESCNGSSPATTRSNFYGGTEKSTAPNKVNTSFQQGTQNSNLFSTGLFSGRENQLRDMAINIRTPDISFPYANIGQLNNLNSTAIQFHATFTDGDRFQQSELFSSNGIRTATNPAAESFDLINNHRITRKDNGMEIMFTVPASIIAHTNEDANRYLSCNSLAAAYPSLDNINLINSNGEEMTNRTSMSVSVPMEFNGRSEEITTNIKGMEVANEEENKSLEEFMRTIEELEEISFTTPDHPTCSWNHHSQQQLFTCTGDVQNTLEDDDPIDFDAFFCEPKTEDMN